jgi:prepilin-type N-terminal cleavage/methylation domain-containing protein
MMRWIRKGRCLRNERGFTLTEMMITIVIWIVMLLALYGLFDMSIRVFSFGNNKVEAMESARLGLERMEREIRAAYPVDSNDPANLHLFFDANGSTSNPPQAMPTATQITFGNDSGAAGLANKKIECPDADNCEYITYKLSAPSNAPPCAASPCSTLLRVNTANSADPGDPVVENVTLAGLNFTYLKSDGTAATTEDEIARVLVSLQIRVAPGTTYEATQRLTTEIDLRNRQ